jgi:hypothetical protein
MTTADRAGAMIRYLAGATTAAELRQRTTILGIDPALPQPEYHRALSRKVAALHALIQMPLPPIYRYCQN